MFARISVNHTIYCMIVNVFSFRWRRWPPKMEGSCEYNR